MKLIDVEQVFCADCEHRECCEEVFCDIHSMPTVDAEPVVRCKDCKHCVLTVDGEYNPQDIVCDWWATDGMKADGFCSYGERRGEDV